MTRTDAPRVLVLGATGSTGGSIAAALDQSEAAITVRATRNHQTADQWRNDGKDAVYIDLDDPRTFAPALAGIDRVFLMAGYTSAMTHQGKTLVDAAEDAGVNFIVHLGVFGDGRSTDPHFAWHELIERYIKGSTLQWTNLHPHVFMENLLTVNRLQGNAFVWAAGHKPVGWVAADDIAAVAAKVLVEGPRVHAGNDYYLSTDLLNAEEVAATLSDALGQHIPAVVLTPQDLQNLIAAGQVEVPSIYDDAYAASALNWLEQTFDGRMDYAALTTTTVPDLLHRPPIHLEQWATSHRQALLAQLQ